MPNGKPFTEQDWIEYDIYQEIMNVVKKKISDDMKAK